MKKEIINEQLTLYLEGEINSSNASCVEKDINSALEGETFSTLTFDFLGISYVSSSGLRIVLRFKQKFPSLKIINVKDDVYNVFEMTGFTKIMEIKKDIKEVSVDNAEIIGSGYFSTVYRVSDDMIIKVFNKTSDDMQIERELKLAKEAFVLGIPTAISYDVVKVKDKVGLRFEMLNCMTLRDAFLKNKDRYTEYLDKYASLLKKINTTVCDDDAIPDMKKNAFKKLDDIKAYFDKDTFDKLYSFLETIEDSNTFVHGDCHFKNIMVQNDEFLLIDMDTLSKGSYLFELASLYCAYIAYEEDEEGNCLKFFGLDSSFCNQLFNDIIDEYIGSDEILLNKIKSIAYFHMLWWNITNEKENVERFENCKKRLLALL